MSKVDELSESVPMEDMEIDNDHVEVDNDLQDIMKIHNDPTEVD